MGVNARFHIGRLARETGRSTHTIRWYEQQGLMPGVTRDAGGRRVYTEQHIGWLLFLDRLRFAGMSVRDMRRYASLAAQGKKTLRQRMELLEAHRARTAATIDELQAALRLIQRKQAYYSRWLEDGHRPGDFEVSPTRDGDARLGVTTATVALDTPGGTQPMVRSHRTAKDLRIRKS